MYDKDGRKFWIFAVMLVAMITFMCQDLAAEASTYSSWEWSNNRSPLGTEGDLYYLKDRVKVGYSVSTVIEEHYIQGTATLVKNKVDPYCYVKISGVWYVHLAGVRTDNGHNTTGWFRESDVVTSAGLDEVSGYMIYKNSGSSNIGVSVTGEVTNSSYTANSSGWIAHSSNGLKYHSVTSGDKLGTYGLYDASTFGLSKKGYEVTAWANVDASGKVHGTYDFTSNYNVNDFITTGGMTLKNSSAGAYIYLVPVWTYTNESPVIKGEDIYIFAGSTWDEGRLLQDVSVWDKEDGDLTDKVYIVNGQVLKIALSDFAAEEVEDTREMELIVEVEDSLGEVTRLVIKVIVYGVNEIVDDYGYVRYISQEYTDTFSSNSVWSDLVRKTLLINKLT